jgi:DNA-binding transcriptional ArsR family regulator
MAVDDTLRALANPTRRAMLELVWDAERSSSEIAEAVGATPARAVRRLPVPLTHHSRSSSATSGPVPCSRYCRSPWL